MICPLRKQGLLRRKELPCATHECQWWNPMESECVLTSINEWLVHVAKELRRISKIHGIQD